MKVLLLTFEENEEDTLTRILSCIGNEQRFWNMKIKVYFNLKDFVLTSISGTWFVRKMRLN